MTEFFNRETEKSKRRRLRNAMPKAEVVLWCRLKGRQLLGCKFRRQFGVGAYVLDFYSPEIRLAVELDGDSHFQLGAREHDEERRTFIESFGIKILRFLNTDIYENVDGVLDAIGREILERRNSLRPPRTPPSQGGGQLVPRHTAHDMERFVVTPTPPRPSETSASNEPICEASPGSTIDVDCPAPHPNRCPA
jgi:very-short-patch-repair endonuclease